MSAALGSAVVDVGLIADHPELLEPMAAACLAEWGDIYRLDYGVTDVAGVCALDGAAALNRTRIPIAMVAFRRDPATGAKTFLGAAQIVDSDMQHAHPELTPWLACVIVVPEARRQGLARRLVQGAQAWAFATLPELDRLWLWTESLHALDLYERLGWTEHERLVYHGHNTVLMVCSRAAYLQAAS